MRHSLAASVSVVAAAVALTGCGLASSSGAANVRLTVTRDFGSHGLATISKGHVSGSESVIRMLESSLRTATRNGGRSVESIDGLSDSGSRRDWFYYVNGLLAARPARTTIHGGDRIWWDLHDWLAAKQPEAVVGSYPEPFVHGAGGKRFPTIVECAPDVNKACRRVSAALSALGVPVASQVLGGGGSGTDSVAVLVGTWNDLRPYGAGVFMAKGPASSGIYAKFSGGSLDLLSSQGQVTRTLGAGAGLIAATAQTADTTPSWVITGTDAAGVLAAASSLNARRLENHFAVAVQGNQVLAVPQ